MNYVNFLLCLLGLLIGLVLAFAVLLEVYSTDVDWFGTYGDSSLSVGDSYGVNQETYNPQQAGLND